MLETVVSVDAALSELACYVAPSMLYVNTQKLPPCIT